jgi:Domain of unknown function (DUF6265)
MRTRGLFVAAFVVCASINPAMRQTPDLTGTWVASDATPPTVPRAPAPAFGERFAMRQSGDALTVVRPSRATPVVTPFVLDGREVRVKIPGALCLGEAETIETGAREGDAVVLSIVGSIPAGGGSVMKREIRRMFRQPDKDTLVVETRMAVQGELRPVATVYKRSTDTIAEPAAASITKTSATIAQVAWIAGTWSGIDKTTAVEERWTPPSGGSMLAVARTMRDNVMGSFEFLCIVERGGTLVYQAMPGGRSPATDFTATAVSADSVTFENPAHDFPKMIRYAKLPDGSLQTTIGAGNGQRERSFVLKRVP